MACRDAMNTSDRNQAAIPAEAAVPVTRETAPAETFYFGVDSAARADTKLQNNLTLFDWVERSKAYPNYWGRYIGGENEVSAEELEFLRRKGCKAAFIFNGCEPGSKILAQQGTIDGIKAGMAAGRLHIPAGTAIFLEVKETEALEAAYLGGFAKALLEAGYTPGFYANTDSLYEFDHQFSRGLQGDPGIFARCLVWAVTPSLPEYFRTTATHFIHPDVWEPFAPSGMAQSQVAIWQYGRECNPINNRSDAAVSFNVSMVRDPSVILGGML